MTPPLPPDIPRPHHFLAAWLRSPLKIGALVPSSRGLARAMALPVDIHKPGAVIELGAGTGIVTHALLHHGLTPQQLVVIERDPRLHAVMLTHFPQLQVLRADAIELDKVLHSMGIARVNSIVSSLPLMSMPKAVRAAIVEQMATLIQRDNGTIVQFTYGPQSPISRHYQQQFGLRGKRMKFVLTNVPPAHVWVYKKT